MDRLVGLNIILPAYKYLQLKQRLSNDPLFEKLFSLEGETALEIASHEDLDDKGQTIKLTEVPKDTPEPSKPVKTGDETTILPYLLLAGAALLFAAGFGILYIRKRKKDK